MNKIKMLNGNVLLKIEDPKKETNSGLIIPSKNNVNYDIGTVVSPDVNNSLKEGDVVYIPKSSGMNVEIENEKYVIVNVKQIILIV